MKRILIVFFLFAMILAGCVARQTATPAASGSGTIPNPASVYCQEHGGSVEMRTDTSGAQYGVCRFADGSECDEWAFYRSQCAPGQSTPAHGTAVPDASPTR
jgi:putative hemolysin